VILLLGDLFYNTSALAIIQVFSRKKRRAGEIFLITVGKLFSKGRPKNVLEEECAAADRKLTAVLKNFDSIGKDGGESV